MLDLSIDSANQLYGWSNIALIFGAVAVLAGTIGVIWATSIRERYADQRISKNEADTALAKADAAKANEEAAKANVKTKTLEIDLEQQRERTAKAQAELLALQERIKARQFTVVQRTRLVKSLSRGEKGEISIDFMAADAESEQFAGQIAEVLRASGWAVTRVGPRIPSGIPTPIGLLLLVRDPQTPRILALVSAFKEIGLSVSISEVPQATPPEQLWVGNKP